ncbi:hypothetical protein SADUNF_Sadunf05G0044000 [Salix dunnii]|uniref:Amidase domain-containing protein n=1 Tax=Salix dunnii TaxID=1413687 RepID=A0A835K9K0_9ROSI|nr:hypothetical protein SADUNF_Sadunf05G0044000 [Salix dunnii]
MDRSRQKIVVPEYNELAISILDSTTASLPKTYRFHMGLFRANGAVHKPVENVNLGPDDEYYLQASVKGSVKMPEALCGVVGFRPTFGRVPHSGVLPLKWTVGTVGVLTGTIEPKVYFPQQQSTSSVPNITLARYEEVNGFFNLGVAILIAVMIFEHAVPKHCTSFLRSLGGRTVNVTIPDIESMRLAHYITIGCDCTAALSSYLEKLSRQTQFHRNIFTKADVIVTPTVGYCFLLLLVEYKCIGTWLPVFVLKGSGYSIVFFVLSCKTSWIVTACPIFYGALKTGELDYINGAAPVRLDMIKNGLPIGLQFVGRPWSEPTLIHEAYAMQPYRHKSVFFFPCKFSIGLLKPNKWEKP